MGAVLGVLSGGVYIPFELRHLLHLPGIISAAVLVANVLIVVFLAHRLWRRRVAIRSSPLA